MQNTGVKVVEIIAILLIVGLLGFGGNKYYETYKELQSTKVEYAIAKKTMEDRIIELEDRIALITGENLDLSANLQSEKDRNDEFEDTLDDLGSTVKTLDKLSKTDRELLQKYSKIYFLNENYVPQSLKEIPEEFVAQKGKELEIHSKVQPFLVDLLEDANESTTTALKIDSAYRSFDTQIGLKSTYKIVYGAGTANSFSAEQGYSEHQLGTTVDFTNLKTGASVSGFENTESYKWLSKNAYKYGFILSYPKGNNFYVYEPWHWRFVGKDLAEKLHDENKNFYDMNQRDIDKYLVKIFD